MQPLLQVDNLSVAFEQPTLNFLAVHKLSFEIAEGSSLALVGESGSGKTLTSRALLALLPKSAKLVSGKIIFDGELYSSENEKLFRRIRGNQISTIFQESKSAFNPVFTIGKQISDVIRRHLRLSKKEARQRVLGLFEKVALTEPERIFKAYAHQLSGGMAQRVMIAMALSCEPKLIVADEPTTALDVKTQFQILKLIRDLQHEQKFSLLLISHDIHVVSKLSQQIVVLKNGRAVESGSTKMVLQSPQADYTKVLIRADLSLPSKEITLVGNETEISVT